MNRIFNNLVAIAKPVEFNPEWKNATGYLDFASEGEHAPILKTGEVLTCVDDWNRKVVIIGTYGDKGNAVIFERYASEATDNVIVGNIPLAVKKDVAASFEMQGFGWRDINGSIDEVSLLELISLISPELVKTVVEYEKTLSVNQKSGFTLIELGALATAIGVSIWGGFKIYNKIKAA